MSFTRVEQVDVAVLAEVPGIPGLQPGVGRDGRGRRDGVVPVAGHVLRRAGPQLADAAGRYVLAVGVDEAHLDPRLWPAARPQQFRPVHGIVIGALELRYGACGFGEAVHADELAAEPLQALDEDVITDR
jgi:hypothetical protein